MISCRRTYLGRVNDRGALVVVVFYTDQEFVRPGTTMRLLLTWACGILIGTICVRQAAASETLVWDLSHDYRTGFRRENPNGDRHSQPTWHFLRTTSRTANVKDRQWFRDGKYARLEYHGASLFDRPVDAWVKYAAGDYRQPVIGRFSLRHDLDLRFEAGDIFFAPGHDDACVLGWRSPVSGTLEIKGSFQHAQKDPGENQGIGWYIERGPAPDRNKGFTAVALASGTSRFGTDSQVGAFHITGESVEPGDFVYFIVDAKADGTEQPHRSDFTRLRAEFSVHDPVEATPPQFETDVLPILAKHCHACHGEDVKESELDLRTVSAILRGGTSGPAAVRGEPAQSHLTQLVMRGKMPPEDEERPTTDEVSIVARWVRHGMPASERVTPPPSTPLVNDAQRRHWAFQMLRQVDPPEPSEVSRVRTPIDAFVLRRLEQEGLGYSPEADRATLGRRAYLDLIGLPPTPKQVDEYLADSAPGAFGRLIDRLLGSSRFGERWGRHWLDVVGYADTVGFDQGAGLIVKPDGKWRYRDYVIEAFNKDKPYDKFIVEQIAGDEAVDWRGAERYTDEIREHLIATGFLRTARDQTHEPESNIPLCYFDVLHDTVEIVCNSLLGLTMQCARCHSHKFDPIPQEDYYRLMAAFTPAYNPDLWKPVFPYRNYIDDRVLLDVSAAERAEIERHNGVLDRQIGKLKAKIGEVRDANRSRLFEAKLAALPEPIRDDVKSALAMAEDQRNTVQKYLAEKFADAMAISDDDLNAALSDNDKATIADLERQISDVNRQRKSWGKIQALFDVGPPPPTFFLNRGQYQSLGQEVVPGFLRVLCDSDEAALAEVVPTGSGSSGRRTALAHRLVDAETPAGALVARVMVNRIWQHLLGEGLVRTPGNFGVQGSPPTHPELFEWLCHRFVHDGWRIKPLVKLIMTSSVYRQTSQTAAAHVVTNVDSRPVDSPAADPARPQLAIRDPNSVDPENRLLWRMRLRRLEAEIVRDSILAVSGKLDITAGGPPIMLAVRPDGEIVVDQSKLPTPTAKWRRSVYLLVRRAYNLSMLSVFDQPMISTTCSRRDNSAVPLQSLTMLNDEFVAENAAQFARRVESEAGPDQTKQIATAYRIALARTPDDHESERCATTLARQQKLFRSAGSSDEQARHQVLTELCHTLLNTSEFLYAE